MAALPATIKSIQSQDDKKSVKVVDLEFGNQEKIKNLPENEIIIKVRAVGINPTDWKHSLGPWGTGGLVVGCDAAGDVVKIGSAVTNVKEGDRVFAFTYGCTNKENGAYAEYARFRANAAVKIPSTMTYAEAASFPIPFHTVVQAFYNRLSLNPPTFQQPQGKRENIIIWGGSSSVGHHAIQLAKLGGYRVITTASKKNHEHLKALGADVTIDYNDSDVAAQIKEAVKEGGLQFGYDTIAEKGSTDVIIDAITTPTGHVVATLPLSEETVNRRPNVKAEFALVYTVIVDGDFKFGNVLPIKGNASDHTKAIQFTNQFADKLFEGWTTSSNGSPFYKCQKLRVGEGLEKVQEGLEYLRDGKVSAEKLVYTL